MTDIKFSVGVKRKHSSGLKPAHKGYLFQDLLTAYVLAKAISERIERVTIDKKIGVVDIFDDLEIYQGGKRKRYQFKSSENINRELNEADFTAKSSSLRFDLLVQTSISAENDDVGEFRLCAAWSPPKIQDALHSLIEPLVAPDGFVNGVNSKLFRIKSDAVWPNNGSPKWACLDKAKISREQFCTFCSKFLIELDLPTASLSLNTLKPIERALVEVLVSDIGIGR